MSERSTSRRRATARFHRSCWTLSADLRDAILKQAGIKDGE